MTTTPTTSSPAAAGAAPLIHWTEGGEARSARWRSERGANPPKKVVIADDSMAADTAYRLACEGTGLLWRGDFQNARLLLQALARRVDKPAKPKREKRVKDHKPGEAVVAPAAPAPVFPEAFHLHRQAQAQRARVLGMVLIPFDADYSIPLRRAPDAKKACSEAWGTAKEGNGSSVASLRELMGFISSHEWRRKGGCLTDFAQDHDFAATGPSFHARRPVGRLDRIVVSRDLRVEDAGTHHSLRARIASDHLPVWAKLSLRSG